MNKVFIGGRVSLPKFSHISRGASMYEFTIENERFSGVVDRIPCVVSYDIAEKITDTNNLHAFTGEIHTRNIPRKDGKRGCEVKFFAKNLYFVVDENYIENCPNVVELEGNICKPPVYRKTPLGKDVCELCIATNRDNGKSDYIPCIAWGIRAIESSNWEVGTRVKILGRFQSREYTKLGETKIAYEVSVARLEVVNGERD